MKSLTLSLPPSPTMGRLGLLCLASNLLGLVLKQISSKTHSQKFHIEEKEVLDRALVALKNVSLEEGSLRDFGVCCPKAVCYRYAVCGGRLNYLLIMNPVPDSFFILDQRTPSCPVMETSSRRATLDSLWQKNSSDLRERT